MKYEFRIGDYAETKDGRRGYVIKSDLLCYQDIVTGYNLLQFLNLPLGKVPAWFQIKIA